MSELSNSVLPDVLVEEILERLPVKPIGQFRCVSKPWRSLLSSPKFLKSHHKLHTLKPIGYLALAPRRAVPCILTLASSESSTAANDGVAIKLQSEVKWSEVIGSCNGLLLFENRDGLLLINPITLETLHILDDREFDIQVCRSFCGVGYDSTNDDYKIVSLSQGDVEDGMGSIVDVYSVRMKCWKRIANNSPYSACHSVGVFLHGCIHWFGYHNSSGAIVCFDLAREEFVEGLYPPRVKKEFVEGEYPVCRIKVFSGCLAVVSFFVNDTLNLWVMREYGVPDSWTKFTTICPEVEEDVMSDVICELNGDEIVGQKYNHRQNQLVAYNGRNGTSRDLDIAGLPGGYIGVTPFKGSLLSPNL